MSLSSRLFASICVSSVFLSACTVDPQLASQLLSSLQKTVKDAAADDNAVTLEDGSVLSTIADAGKKYQVVCGGDMTVASVDEETAETTTSEAALEEADTVEPIVIAPTATTAAAPAKRVRLSADLQGKLRQLNQVKGAERQRQFKNIQGQYPEMRNTQAVPVRNAQTGAQQTIFIYIGTQGQAVQPPQPGQPANFTQARPAMPAPAGRPGRPGMTPAQPPQPGFGGGHYGGGQFAGGQQPVPATRPVKAVSGQPATRSTSASTAASTSIGFAGAIELGGQTCRVVARETADDTTDTTSDSSDSSDTAE